MTKEIEFISLKDRFKEESSFTDKIYIEGFIPKFGFSLVQKNFSLERPRILSPRKSLKGVKKD